MQPSRYLPENTITMRAFFMLCFCLVAVYAGAQFNPLTNPLVYQHPDMSKVTVRKGVVFKTIHADTVLKFDIYYPPGFNNKTNLPVVIFNNGVGGNEVPEWKIYQDWARLIASHGMIAITHQSRQRKTETDLRDLLTHIRTHASEIKADPDRIALWACSANTPTAWPVADDPANNFIQAIAIYYGFIPQQHQEVRRRDLEVLLVRAGLDSHNINIGMETLMINALQRDRHTEFISYPEGQHAFDGVDHTPRSKEIILQTVDFFKRNLLGDNSEVTSTISNRAFWNLVLNEKKTDEAIIAYEAAFKIHNNKPVKYPFWNQILHENNLTALGYQLLQQNRIDDAIGIFKVNASHFEDSPNVYDALGDAYERAGDRENTLRYSQMALETLKTASNIPAQFAQAIRESAQTKINNIESANNLPHKRAHHEVVFDGTTNSILLIGGSTPLNGGQSYKFFNDIWQLDGSKWLKKWHAGDERSGIRTAFHTKEKKLYSFGGFTPDNKTSGQLRVLENGDWKILADIDEMKAAEAGFVYDEARNKLFAFISGADREATTGQTWEWSGAGWKKLKVNNPPALQAFVMVYDAARQRTVLFGGIGNDQKLSNDTWEFDGKAWKRISTDGPGARMAAGGAFDAARSMVVIFGGNTTDGPGADTWGWNGKVWKKLADGGPSPRMMGQMAYDPTCQKIILFGGREEWPNDVNDTWAWDGTKWTEISQGR